MKVMTVLQQLKKREIGDKKEHFKGYSGQVSFKSNPNIIGFSGMRRNVSGKLEPCMNAIAREKQLARINAEKEKARKKFDSIGDKK
jgi:hypothetical protein